MNPAFRRNRSRNAQNITPSAAQVRARSSRATPGPGHSRPHPPRHALCHVPSSCFWPSTSPQTPFISGSCTACTYITVFQGIFCSPVIRLKKLRAVAGGCHRFARVVCAPTWGHSHIWDAFRYTSIREKRRFPSGAVQVRGVEGGKITSRNRALVLSLTCPFYHVKIREL